MSTRHSPLLAYPGEPGAFAEDAAHRLGAGTASGRPGFRAVFEAVSLGEADGGVLPIENVLGGTVRETYDLLLAHELAIVGEVVVPIRLCLAALRGERLEGITRVYSHVQALGQAERFLDGRGWTLLTTYNTAAAGRLLVERDERGAAAVLSPRAAHALGLAILADAVEDDPDDRTRFLAVARPGSWRPPSASGPGPARTTLVLGLTNAPGALARALAVLAEAGLNLSKLESRPLAGQAWAYVFWIDLDALADEPAAAEALARLGGMVSFLRVLGSYRRDPA